MRAVAGTGSLELHFSSPHAMNEALGPCLEGAPLTLPADLSLPPGVSLQPGDTREVIVHVPWLGRRLRLRGMVVQGPAPPSSPTQRPPIHLKLANGDWDTLALLAEVLGKVTSGAMLEPDAGEINPEKRIMAMSPTLRALLASKANPAERLVLARDPDPRVVEALLRNPSLTLDEARRLAARTNLNQAHFSHLVRHPAWMTDEMMRLTLARNPRLPEFIADQVLPLLALPALKTLAESPNITSSTRRVAVRILASRGIVVGARRAWEGRS